MDEAERMRAEWDARADRDAVAYIETTHDGDLEAFFAAGEERATRTVDPALETWDRYDPDADLVALDVGCGIGRTTRPLAARFDRAIGVDVSPEMVRRAREANREFDDLTFHVVDGVSLDPVETGGVDFAYSYEVLQHAPSREVIRENVAEVARVLAPGGRCCLHFQPAPAPDAPADPRASVGRHVRRFVDAARAALPPPVGDHGDPLKRSDSWTGTAIAAPELWRLLEDAGLDLVAFHPDPTHDTGARLLAVADRPVAG